MTELIDCETACSVNRELKGLAPSICSWYYTNSPIFALGPSNTSTDLGIPLRKTSNGQRSIRIEELLKFRLLFRELLSKRDLKHFFEDQSSQRQRFSPHHFLVNRAVPISDSLPCGPHKCANTVNATDGGWPSGCTACFTVFFALCLKHTKSSERSII